MHTGRVEKVDRDLRVVCMLGVGVYGRGCVSQLFLFVLVEGFVGMGGMVCYGRWVGAARDGGAVGELSDLVPLFAGGLLLGVGHEVNKTVKRVT